MKVTIGNNMLLRLSCLLHRYKYKANVSNAVRVSYVSSRLSAAFLLQIFAFSSLTFIFPLVSDLCIISSHFYFFKFQVTTSFSPHVDTLFGSKPSSILLSLVPDLFFSWLALYDDVGPLKDHVMKWALFPAGSFMILAGASVGNYYSIKHT